MIIANRSEYSEYYNGLLITQAGFDRLNVQLSEKPASVRCCQLCGEETVLHQDPFGPWVRCPACGSQNERLFINTQESAPYLVEVEPSR